MIRDNIVCGEAKVMSDVTEWVTWSMTPHTEDEIRYKCLTDYDNVCFSYLCKFSDMSADFIEELMALSTGLIDIQNYDEYIEDIKKGIQIRLGLEEGKLEDLNIPEIITRDSNGKVGYSIGYNRVYDKIDWVYISQKKNLPQWFRLKYRNFLVQKEIDSVELKNDWI